MDNCDSDNCNRIKSLLYFDKISTENKLLNLILEKNSIILKLDSLILELLDEINNSNVHSITLERLKQKVLSRFD